MTTNPASRPAVGAAHASSAARARRAVAVLALATSTLANAAVAHAESPQEDDPGWSCVDAGNRVCGPLSDDWGHTPGCYDDGGVIVALWPCEAWKPSDGHRHGTSGSWSLQGDGYASTDADGTVTR